METPTKKRRLLHCVKKPAEKRRTPHCVKKKPEKRRMVHTYLTPEEKQRIEQKAAELGISVSSYIKIKLFAKND